MNRFPHPSRPIFEEAAAHVASIDLGAPSPRARNRSHNGLAETTTKKEANMNTADDSSNGRTARQLLGLTSGLLILQVLNLAVFDDLRTDSSVGVLETFTKPQHLSSIVAVLLAVVLVARRHRLAAPVAAVVAWIEIVTFTFFHGIPVEIGPSKPYWGDGMGDAGQWIGFLSILACSAAIVMVARQRTSRATLLPITTSRSS